MFTIKKTTSRGALTALFASSICLLNGCEATEEYEEYDELRSWTAYTSEEYPPLECPYGYAAQGVDCDGSYCDNVALYCTDTGRQTGWTTWGPNFSEEGSGSADEGHCVGGDAWVTGVNCSGSYCDNLSLRCSQIIGSSTGTCWWSAWYSEEQGSFFGNGGTYLKGMECDGSYCDNKRYRYCQMY